MKKIIKAAGLVLLFVLLISCSMISRNENNSEQSDNESEDLQVSIASERPEMSPEPSVAEEIPEAIMPNVRSNTIEKALEKLNMFTNVTIKYVEFKNSALPGIVAGQNVIANLKVPVDTQIILEVNGKRPRYFMEDFTGLIAAEIEISKYKQFANIVIQEVIADMSSPEGIIVKQNIEVGKEVFPSDTIILTKNIHNLDVILKTPEPVATAPVQTNTPKPSPSITQLPSMTPQPSAVVPSATPEPSKAPEIWAMIKISDENFTPLNQAYMNYQNSRNEPVVYNGLGMVFQSTSTGTADLSISLELFEYYYKNGLKLYDWSDAMYIASIFKLKATDLMSIKLETGMTWEEIKARCEPVTDYIAESQLTPDKVFYLRNLGYNDEQIRSIGAVARNNYVRVVHVVEKIDEIGYEEAISYYQEMYKESRESGERYKSAIPMIAYQADIDISQYEEYVKMGFLFNDMSLAVMMKYVCNVPYDYIMELAYEYRDWNIVYEKIK